MTYGFSFAAARSRRFSSDATASRMNSARRFFPTMASMRSTESDGSLTRIGFTFKAGRPNFFSRKAISLIDTLTDIA